MPTYTYRCENCDYHFDLYQRFDDPDPTTCPNCEHVNELVRVYKPVGVVFKGSGFYATDNKSKSGLSVNGTKADAAAGGSEKSADAKSGTDTAPASSKKSESAGSDSKSASGGSSTSAPSDS